MAMRGRMSAVLVMMLAVLALLLVHYVERTDASYGMVEFMSPGGVEEELEELSYADMGDESLDEPTRRMLGSRRTYISYGALDRNSASCPARSGRSYYTPRCSTARGSARPYRRGCIQITRCARG